MWKKYNNNNKIEINKNYNTCTIKIRDKES